VHAVAERARKQWRAIQTANVGALRDADVINRFTALTHVQRSSARIVRSIMTDHRCARLLCRVAPSPALCTCALPDAK
jgi:hypothetical protein